MDPSLATSGSKSESADATGYQALVLCTNRASKQKNKVKALVIDTDDEIKEMVATLLKGANDDCKSIIGFEVEYEPSFGTCLPMDGHRTRISHFIFTNGSMAYLLFLSVDPRLPGPLLFFLQHSEFTFVSMGMQRHVKNLVQLYEVGCRNAVDLGELASQLKGNPHLKKCGIDLLAKGIGLSETPTPSSVVFNKFDKSKYIDEDEMSERVVHTWVYQQIGKLLYS
ncbi:hypothetical protein OROGR_012152 [Orobanche gracilis]